MTKDNSFRKAFYYLKNAEIFFEDVVRENPGKVAGAVSKRFVEKIQWMFRDFKTDPRLPSYALDDFATEFKGDVLFFESLSSKCLNLTEAQREVLESVVDDFILGIKVTVQIS